MAGDWLFGALTPRAYSLILIDPPWNFRPRKVTAAFLRKAPAGKYRTMSLDQIAALPVRELASRRGAVLVMWTTQAQLDDAVDIMRYAYGFRFTSAGGWGKRTRRGKWAIGTGFWLRSTVEFYLLGTIGSPALPVSRGERNFIDAAAREHSRKPDEMHRMLERMFPYGRRCELFAREARAGWDCWGDEVDKFGVCVGESESRASKGRSRGRAIQRPIFGRSTRTIEGIGRGQPPPAAEKGRRGVERSKPVQR
jgi:N6-adenosine-specific RNA methylase IME4